MEIGTYLSPQQILYAYLPAIDGEALTSAVKICGQRACNKKADRFNWSGIGTKAGES